MNGPSRRKQPPSRGSRGADSTATDADDRPAVRDVEVEVEVDVRIEALAPGGDAVGRQVGGSGDGRATFVALAAPGEYVRARVTRSKARVAWAELREVVEPSVHRVEPPCPIFGRCGGCQWQHISLDEQRSAKRAIVARALGLRDVPLRAPTAGGAAYRDRAQLVVGDEGQIGFRARRSHDVVDVARCLLLAAPLQAALDALRASASWLPSGMEIDLQAGREGVHVTLRPARQGSPGPGWTLASLPAAWLFAGVVGVRLIEGEGARQRVRSIGLPDVDLAGTSSDERALRIPAGAFAQVGRSANHELVATVMAAVGDAPGSIVELYAGSGNFTRGLVARAPGRVIACDGDVAAVARGRQNVPEARWFERAPSVIDAETVLADPPRQGLDAENLRAALQTRRRLVYVSCDPQTLGRDVTRLRQSGLELVGAVALDLMPHTYHVEVVATFDRRSPVVARSRR